MRFSCPKSTSLTRFSLYNLNTSLGNGESMTYIYLDVLIITNIYVNYFLLKGTARISHTALSLKRCIIASLLGTISALTILLPLLNILVTSLIKLLSALFIIRIAFSKLSLKRFVKLTLIFFGINFIFAGVMLVICEITKVSAIIVHNYSIYFNISILTLAISTIIAYIIVCIVTNILDKKCNSNHSFKVLIEIFGEKFTLNAICDTGNSLVDTFTGKPVIVCSSDGILELANLEKNKTYSATDYLDLMKNFKGLRLLPYSTIGGEGIIPAFLAEKVYIINEKNEIKPVDAYIGLSLKQKSEFEAIFNPRLLI